MYPTRFCLEPKEKAPKAERALLVLGLLDVVLNLIEKILKLIERLLK